MVTVANYHREIFYYLVAKFNKSYSQIRKFTFSSCTIQGIIIIIKAEKIGIPVSKLAVSSYQSRLTYRSKSFPCRIQPRGVNIFPISGRRIVTKFELKLGQKGRY